MFQDPTKYKENCEIIARSTRLKQYNYESKGFYHKQTYGGDKEIYWKGDTISFSESLPEIKKNNYDYYEFSVNTDNMEMQGSSASYELELAKYSTFFLMADLTL